MPLKKVVAIGVIAVIGLLMIGSTADAGTGTISGTSLKQCVCFSATGAVVSCSGSFAIKRCSIDVATILKGLGKVTGNGNTTAALYDVKLFIQHATVFCVNKANNAFPANGQPFEGLEIEQKDAILNKEIDKNGKALSDLFFTDEFMLEQAGVSIADLCPNANWSGRVFVDELQALGRLFRDDDPANLATPCNLDPNNGPIVIDDPSCTLADSLGVSCVAPTGATVTAPFDYVCTTECTASGVPAACPLAAPFFPLP